MLFEEKHMGKLISPQLSEYISKFTDVNDYAVVSEKTGVSISTIKNVIKRHGALTESNSNSIVEVVRKAISNCTNRIEYAKKARKHMERELVNERVDA